MARLADMYDGISWGHVNCVSTGDKPIKIIFRHVRSSTTLATPESTAAPGRTIVYVCVLLFLFSCGYNEKGLILDGVRKRRKKELKWNMMKRCQMMGLDRTTVSWS
jgi:hypothetical protein